MTLAEWIRRDRALVPDSRMWGRGFGGDNYSQLDLNETAGYIAEKLQHGGRQGYGPRFFSSCIGYHRVGKGSFVVPSGFDAIGCEIRYRQGASPDELDPEWLTRVNRPEQLEQQQNIFWTDQHNRPCHPLTEQLIADERIGLNTGLGQGRVYGEWPVVNAIVCDGQKVLLTQRPHNSKEIPSLVGGYCQYAELGVSPLEWRAGNWKVTEEALFIAAFGRVLKKTGITLPADAKYKIVYALRPVGSVHTLNFWTATYAILITLDRGSADLLPPAKDTPAIWQNIRDVDMSSYWNDHKRAYQAAMAHI